ncbi:dipeptidase [Lacibacter sediminis]|uniref:Membrane dipeptidase n=1 Tax=Lacibacter sediminis TaxID=2760713 RepID=A0A7G5XGB8_9BACT|nr:dipeptidase [Lacibacter sediminis]QNA44521.1 membrane dipeptidase [Lacibacter sediminis]
MLVRILLLLLVPSLLFAQNYKKIHKAAILVDTHNDIPSSAIEKKLAFDTDLRGKTHSDLNRMFAGGVDAQMFSIFCGGEQKEPYAFANQEMDSVYAWANRNPSKMRLVYTPADFKKAMKEKKLATMFGVEGGHMIENDLAKLNALHKRGMRYMTITWNNSTPWATSAADETTPGGAVNSEGKKGLTEFGKQVIKRMNELGVMVDISHVGEQTFWDITKLTTKPIIASHSCVWNLCPHRRNLKDEQIKAIAKSGGVIFLNFYAGFIDSSYEAKRNQLLLQYQPEIDSLIKTNMQPDYARIITAEKYKDQLLGIRPSLSVLLDHLDYIVKLVGVDHVGMGSDFDGIEAPPLELNGVEDYPLITKALLERGYSKKNIRKILGGNFIRVFAATMKNIAQ